jgi:hypothetical protein
MDKPEPSGLAAGKPETLHHFVERRELFHEMLLPRSAQLKILSTSPSNSTASPAGTIRDLLSGNALYLVFKSAQNCMSAACASACSPCGALLAPALTNRVTSWPACCGREDRLAALPL